jgi:hypothetical protein
MILKEEWGLILSMVHMIIGELNALPPVDTEQVKDYMKS